MADNADPTQYDPRVQAMEEIHFDWRCIVCCMVALSPLHLEQQHLPGTDSVYFDSDNTPWVKCDKCHTPFHLQCATWESIQIVRSKCFPTPSPCHLIYISILFPQFFKMGRRPLCPDDKKPKKKKKGKKSEMDETK